MTTRLLLLLLTLLVLLLLLLMLLAEEMRIMVWLLPLPLAACRAPLRHAGAQKPLSTEQLSCRYNAALWMHLNA